MNSEFITDREITTNIVEHLIRQTVGVVEDVNLSHTVGTSGKGKRRSTVTFVVGSLETTSTTAGLRQLESSLRSSRPSWREEVVDVELRVKTSTVQSKR